MDGFKSTRSPLSYTQIHTLSLQHPVTPTDKVTMRYPNVLRIYATTHKPDFDLPWQRERIKSATGSGVLVGPNLILTGAHVIHHATFIQVQRIDDVRRRLAAPR